MSIHEKESIDLTALAADAVKAHENQTAQGPELQSTEATPVLSKQDVQSTSSYLLNTPRSTYIPHHASRDGGGRVVVAIGTRGGSRLHTRRLEEGGISRTSTSEAILDILQRTKLD
jgi:hypothetical protein